ncbi:hypothetical protein CANARDRAFT_201520 [[Candida] arabinofermentans NRRL YB-2248]|uniref:Cation efflux protein cytoplasmic domain-containing protein n=1 Tax=[Candida] arabinofermentans NRRL YB-2248 TaxID=983967 RepID=A0A1E4SXK4_9ASCO|nr:hypothetical protein CANARDRAFT_201520 [[Candida] arabinofermentans NRRL YB-2248]
MQITKKEVKILTLLGIDTIFFFLEIIIGYAVNSLALIADSFHMLNDIISLLVALWAVNVAKTKEADSSYTYGWQRAEILGALINAVFLLALCFTIAIEAVQRFLSPQEISNPQLILIVGGCGLLSNIAGLFLFHDHGHSHGGGGGHSHGGVHLDDPEIDDSDVENVMPSVVVSKLKYSYAENADYALIHKSHNHVINKGISKNDTKSLNMQGVFLHVMGDALGNVGVMATAIFIWKTDYSWRFYSDPCISLIITAIIFSSALPLCKSSSRILLQGTPQSVDFDDVKEDILNVEGVLSVHDFHIWNLTERQLIASLHVDLSISPENFLTVASTIKGCLHDYGIHSATIQPEFSFYYASINKLPKRYSSTHNLPTLASAEASNEASSLLPSNGSGTPQYGAAGTLTERGNSTCLVDATIGCTAKGCIKGA